MFEYFRAYVWCTELHLEVSQIRHNVLWKPVLQDLVSTCTVIPSIPSSADLLEHS